jgi:hypothetical protein
MTPAHFRDVHLRAASSAVKLRPGGEDHPHFAKEGSLMATLDRTKADPWQLKTPPGTADYTMHVEEKDGKTVLVCTVGKTVLHYDARCIDDLLAMLKAEGDWMELGGTDEQKPAKDGTVEAWGRSPTNPIGGWYGLKKGLRGRFGVYLPPLMEELGLCELEHNPKNNRIRAK